MMRYAKLASSEYAKLKVGKVRTFSDTVKPTLLRLRFSFLAWSQYDEHGDDDEVDLSFSSIWWQGHHGDDGSDGVGGGLLPAGPDNHAATKVPGDKSDPRYPLTTGDHL